MEERYWENWDKPEVASSIDSYWRASEVEANWRKHLAEDLSAHFPKNSNILEIGCGSGLIYKLMLDHKIVKPTTYQGGDTSLKMLEIARHEYPDVRFDPLDIFKLPFEDSSQPNVVCIQVLQHLPAYEEAVTELVRICRDKLYIVTWFNYEAQDIIAFTGATADGTSFYNNAYSLARFEAFLYMSFGSRIKSLACSRVSGVSHSIAITFGQPDESTADSSSSGFAAAQRQYNEEVLHLRSRNVSLESQLDDTRKQAAGLQAQLDDATKQALGLQTELDVVKKHNATTLVQLDSIKSRYELKQQNLQRVISDYVRSSFERNRIIAGYLSRFLYGIPDYAGGVSDQFLSFIESCATQNGIQAGSYWLGVSPFLRCGRALCYKLQAIQGHATGMRIAFLLLDDNSHGRAALMLEILSPQNQVIYAVPFQPHSLVSGTRSTIDLPPSDGVAGKELRIRLTGLEGVENHGIRAYELQKYSPLLRTVMNRKLLVELLYD